MAISLSHQRNVIALIQRFLPYRRRIIRQWWQTAALDFIGPLMSVALLWSVKILIDDVFIAGHFNRLAGLAAIYFAASAALLAIGYALTRIEASATEQIALDLRGALYRHILSLSPGSLRQANGDLLTRLSSDVGSVEYLVYSGMLGLLNNIVRTIIFGTVLFILSWQLTVCTMIIGPLVALVSIRTTPSIRRASRLARRAVGAWASFAEERLGAIPIVQACSAHEQDIAAFTRSLGNARKAELRVVKIQAFAAAMIEIVAALGGLVVMFVGAMEIQLGALTVGTFVAFLGSVGSLLGPLRGLAKASGRFQRATVRAQRVIDILDTPSLVADRPSARPLLNCKGKLEFRNVCFGYARGQPVLDEVSLRLEPDETVAIVGPSGSGKSTLVNLAMRFYDPSAGAVLIDDSDVRDVTLKSLRRAVTAVFQEPYVFRGSIADNIGYGEADRSDARLHAAARAARAESFVSALPAGYDTAVGPRGAWLSGGQRQRIALARALNRDARIIILDEATASLDSETEELMREAMDRYMGRKTILIIGHRLSSVRNADRVIVVENGRVVETGTPAGLLRTGTRYHELFAAQTSGVRISA
jgi:ABC-type multidrug transport system fused ATPase/permease subunit